MKPDGDDVVRVYSGPLVLVEVYQGVLTEAGIESRVVGTELSGGIGSALPATTELWVHRDDLARAEGLISREEQAKPKAPHDRVPPHFPHPTSDPKPAPAPHRREPYVNPDPGA